MKFRTGTFQEPDSYCKESNMVVRTSRNSFPPNYLIYDRGTYIQGIHIQDSIRTTQLTHHAVEL